MFKEKNKAQNRNKRPHGKAKPPKCPYCGKKSKLEDSSEVYSKSYGLIYLCKDCNAYVGVHKGTKIPLGRLANEVLRRKKRVAHYYFDFLWNRKIEKENCSRRKARYAAYKWLAECLEISKNKCHIGMFDEETCEKVVEVCKPHVLRIKAALNIA